MTIQFCFSGLLLFLSYFLQQIYFSQCHTEKVPSLLVFSFSGFRWDYISKANNTQHFDRFLKEGVHAKQGIKSVFETSTLPNLWSLVTGLYPESHGILGDVMFDTFDKNFFPSKHVSTDREALDKDGKYFDSEGVEPIWVTNQRQNNFAKSGVVLWPGALYSIKWSRPTFYINRGENKNLNSKQRIDKLIEWISLEEEPINLGLVSIDEPSITAQQYGSESEHLIDAIRKADELVGYILSSLTAKGLLESTNIIVTSDHGIASVSPDNVIRLDNVITKDLVEQIVETSPLLSIVPAPGMEDKLYQRLRQLADKPNSHFRVWKKENIPDRFHYKNNVRVTPIVALADLHYFFLINSSDHHNLRSAQAGYDNLPQDMHPFFLAMGPSFRKGFSVNTFNIVDLYPLMCHLLGLKPSPNNGSMTIVSKLLSAHETTMWTFGTYIFILIFISSIGVVYAVAACRQHRYLKRKRKQTERMSFQGGIRYSVPTKGTSVVRLLSYDEDDDNDYFDNDDDDDDDDDPVISRRKEKRSRRIHH